MRRMVDGFRTRLADEDGQALVEYALLVSLVAVVCAGAVGTFGTGVAGLYSNVQSLFP